MPLEHYERDGRFWLRGKIDAIPGDRYRRRSLKTSSEAEAIRRLASYEKSEIKRHFVGHEKALTFGEAVLLYESNVATAAYLVKIVPHLQHMTVAEITGEFVRRLCPKIYPNASTDTWKRQVITPVSAVINNAHDLGKAPPIRIRGFTAIERMAQDRARGKQSRVEKTPSDWEWIEAFREAAPPNLGAMALFMFLKAARLSQMIALEPDDLDLQNARVRLPECKGFPEAWVDIPIEVAVDLANLEPRRPRPRRKGGPRPRLRVFGYASKSSVYKPWRRACKDAGIEEIMPHAAGRHGFGTMAALAGIDPKSAAKEGRWANPNEMQKTYAHAVRTSDEIQEQFRTIRVQAAKKGRG